ncbi:MAG: radical SAM protein [Thermoguttaceae bacterium]|nr:radical SAM protein [Thermoguttaceae bacterium]
MQFSSFVHTIETPHSVSLYHSLTTKVFFITPEQAESLRQKNDLERVFSEDEMQRLSRKGFLNDTNQISIADLIQKNGQETPDIFALYLILTEKCNMDCLYCSQSAFRTRDRMNGMSLESLSEILKKFYTSKTTRKRTIVLYGGEPTLNRAGIDYAVRYVRETMRDQNADIVIFTNGILLDEELIDFFNVNHVSIILSLDGPQEIHDKYRLWNGKGSFERVSQAIRKLQEKNIPFGISSTIASHTVTHLKELIEGFITAYHPVTIGLNPLHYVPAGRESIAVDVQEMARSMTEAYDTAREHGIYIEQIMRRVRPFVLATPRFKDCPSCGGMIRALPNGCFGPCGHFMEEQKEIELPTYSFEESQIMKKWNERISPSIPGCAACPALGLCGGGCPYNSLKNGGCIFSSNDERSCCQAKLMLNHLIELLAKDVQPRGFYEVTAEDKKRLLGNIDLDLSIPMKEYSKYGEFELDEQYK